MHIQVNRSLRREFAGRLAGWEWDVALLQEAPPRWLGELERATGADGVRDLTARNSIAPLRAAIADWNPDLIKSHEGGSNMLLVRPPARIVATRAETLTTRPERRRLLMARLELPQGQRVVVACMHLSVPSTGHGRAEALHAAELAVEWAAGEPVGPLLRCSSDLAPASHGTSSEDRSACAPPLVFGGDLNLRPADHRAAFDDLRERFGLAAPTGPHAIDHLLARSLEPVERPEALPAVEREVAGPDGLAIRLSDHAPVVASFGLR